MANELVLGTYTFPQSTGLRRGRFVAVGTNGKLKYPAAGGSGVIGVLISEGTTGSTAVPKRGGTVQLLGAGGIAKVEAVGGTLSRGSTVAFVSASSRGMAKASTAAGRRLGYVVAGTSGSTGRMLTVLLAPMGSTA